MGIVALQRQWQMAGGLWWGLVKLREGGDAREEGRWSWVEGSNEEAAARWKGGDVESRKHLKLGKHDEDEERAVAMADHDGDGDSEEDGHGNGQLRMAAMGLRTAVMSRRGAVSGSQ